MSLDKAADWANIVCAICAPPALLFTMAVFFQWKPETFSNLGIMNIPPFGTILIIFLFGVFPWIALYIAHRKTRIPLMGEEDSVRRMSEGIRDVIRQLVQVRNQLNSYKGQPDKPYPNAYQPLNEIQQQIHEVILVKLQSLLPDRE